MTRNQQILIGVAVLILLGGGGYYSMTKPAVEDSTSGVNEDGKKTEEQKTEETATSTDKPNYTVKVESLTPPTLDRQIVVTAQLTVAQKTQAEAKIKELTSKLKQNSNQHPLLIDLGAYWRTIGDYDGARQVWEYVTQVWPADSVAYSNLGTLYAENLKNNAKAESYFLAAINKDPAYGYSYIQLAEFYHDTLKNDAKAREILQKGIIASPASATELKGLLEVYSG